MTLINTEKGPYTVRVKNYTGRSVKGTVLSFWPLPAPKSSIFTSGSLHWFNHIYTWGCTSMHASIQTMWYTFLPPVSMLFRWLTVGDSSVQTNAVIKWRRRWLRASSKHLYWLCKCSVKKERPRVTQDVNLTLFTRKLHRAPLIWISFLFKANSCFTCPPKFIPIGHRLNQESFSHKLTSLK